MQPLFQKSIHRFSKSNPQLPTFTPYLSYNKQHNTNYMSSFIVQGGNKLKGTIIPQGAKNEALQIISAVLLTASPVTVNNIPDILDVNLLIELLADMGVKVNRVDRHTCIFTADEVDTDYFTSEAFRIKGGRLRGSVLLAGPMLARFKKAYIPKPTL